MYIGWRGPGLQSVVTAASARKDGLFLFSFLFWLVSLDPPQQ
jgi:hypothetical protein